MTLCPQKKLSRTQLHHKRAHYPSKVTAIFFLSRLRFVSLTSGTGRPTACDRGFNFLDIERICAFHVDPGDILSVFDRWQRTLAVSTTRSSSRQKKVSLPWKRSSIPWKAMTSYPSGHQLVHNKHYGGY